MSEYRVNSKSMFILLVCLVSLVGVWMGGRFIHRLYEYFLLTSHVRASHINWDVEECNPNRFVVAATFECIVKGETLSRRYVFNAKTYQNPYLAQATIQELEHLPLEVWYNPRNLQMVSLEKTLPIKEAIYFGLCLLIVLYFAWLRTYVHKLASVDQPGGVTGREKNPSNNSSYDE